MKPISHKKKILPRAFASWLLLVIFCLQSCSKDEPANLNNNASSDSNKPGSIILSTGASYVTPAVEDIVMYEINIGSFSNTHNLRGVINRLDNIQSLGVNTIWLMPTYPIGIVNSFGSPYCVRDYLGVNQGLGTLSDLRELVSKAHQRHLSVILDWVGNHTSWDNAWISSHPQWYTHNTSGAIISPPGTNWNDVADLNYDNAEMRLAMIAAMRYWINTAEIDGFRCDAADYIPFDFWQQAITSLQSGRSKQLIMLAEGRRADHFTAGFKINWAWDYQAVLKNVFSAVLSPASLFTTNTNEYAVVPSGSRKLRFTTNHDESNTAVPLTVYNGKDGALCASAVTIFLQGVPLIYSGQEVGVASSGVYSGGTIDWNANADMLLAYQKMLTFYNSSEAARKGTVANFSDANIAAYTKTSGSEQILVLVNTRAILKGYTIPAQLAGNYVNIMSNTNVTLSTSFGFPAYKFMVLKRLNP